MSNLGTDFIFTEILPRLPGKSLMRFKCVSKSFNSAISSPDFALQYLRYHTLPSPDLLILPEFCRVICHDLDSNTATATFYWPDYVNILGSSNGLICLHMYVYNNVTNWLCVLNPTTRICQYIPYPIPVTSRLALGFAFDPYNLDFKIMEVCQRLERIITRVYSLNTKSWTVIQSNFSGDSLKHDFGCGTVINNHLLHWTFWSESLKKFKIYCFDVCKNEWVADVLLPHFYYNTTHKIHLARIGVLYGSLFASFANSDKGGNGVWVIKEYGVQDSWFKLLSIPFSMDLQHVPVPVAYRRGFTEVLIRQRSSTKLLWHNRHNGELSEAIFVGAPNYFGDQACMCTRSIVDLPDGKLFVNSEGFPG